MPANKKIQTSFKIELDLNNRIQEIATTMNVSKAFIMAHLFSRFITNKQIEDPKTMQWLHKAAVKAKQSRRYTAKWPDTDSGRAYKEKMDQEFDDLLKGKATTNGRRSKTNQPSI